MAKLEITQPTSPQPKGTKVQVRGYASWEIAGAGKEEGPYGNVEVFVNGQKYIGYFDAGNTPQPWHTFTAIGLGTGATATIAATAYKRDGTIFSTASITVTLT